MCHSILTFEENAKKKTAVGNTALEPRKMNERKQEAAGDVRSREAAGGGGAALSRSVQSVDDVLTWLGKLKLPLRDLARYQVSVIRLFVTNFKGSLIRMSESGGASKKALRYQVNSWSMMRALRGVRG